jgi:hypothetical protein
MLRLSKATPEHYGQPFGAMVLITNSPDRSAHQTATGYSLVAFKSGG